MRNDTLRWTILRSSTVIVLTVGLAGAAIGCEILPAPPSAEPSPTATQTPHVILHTATPLPTTTPLPTMTPSPTRTPRPTATVTPSPSPTITPTMPLTATVTPAISPTPTELPCQLKAWVSEPNPVKGSHIIVYGQLTCQDQSTARAQMYVVCRYRALRARYPQSGFERTDEDGVGRVGLDTTHATPGETVVVDVYVRHWGREYRTQTSFQAR